jgi:hypothetical protein
MEYVLVLALFAGFLYLKSQEQGRRIALLASHLGKFDLEKLMESLMDGYLRALGESAPERQTQVWGYLASQEEKLRDQFAQFAKDFSDVWADNALVSTLPVAIPRAEKLFPAATFDVRKLFEIHARGIDEVVRNAANATPKDRAYMLTAEMMLMQHSCHWFCRSKTVASARLLARHQTRYEQVLAAVSPTTRNAYQRLIKG